MSTLTISRESGSEGRRIAERTAVALGYHLVDKRTIEDVLVQYGFVEFRKEYETTVSAWDRLDLRREELIDMLNRVIRALARHGNVIILGRGSFAVLQGLSDVLNVRIQAPRPVRIRRVMEERGIADTGRAESLVNESDRVRATFIETYYKLRWDAASAFDLVIDTGKITSDAATVWLIEAIRALSTITPPLGAPTTRSLNVDEVLATAVADTLKCQAAH